MTTATDSRVLMFDASEDDIFAMREVLFHQFAGAPDFTGELPTLAECQRIRDLLNRWVPIYEALESGKILVTDEVIDRAESQRAQCASWVLTSNYVDERESYNQEAEALHGLGQKMLVARAEAAAAA